MPDRILPALDELTRQTQRLAEENRLLRVDRERDRRSAVFARMALALVVVVAVGGFFLLRAGDNHNRHDRNCAIVQARRDDHATLIRFLRKQVTTDEATAFTDGLEEQYARIDAKLEDQLNATDCP